MFAVNSERFLFNQCFTPSEGIIMTTKKNQVSFFSTSIFLKNQDQGGEGIHRNLFGLPEKLTAVCQDA